MKTIKKPIKSEIKIKKSQFICRLYPAKTQSDSKEIINKISNKYSDATHNCTAYIVDDGEGFDDDGEPSGTAGKPMLNALRKNDLHNIVAIVTRYFGGIKLGAGGLVRAYNKSVLEAISESEIIEIEHYDIYQIIFNYNDLKQIEQELRKYQIHIIAKSFEDKVSYDIISKESENIKKIKEKLKLISEINFKCKKALEKI
ncbi:YigZ family protein [Methanobrevibacter sp. DSM 116169]|uniref:YigZ family protein n=1 Tax=Methanobrevibacter sp. DSM 116169 TaxID=3242727 RepID=UPI0038FD1EF9